MRGEAEIGDLPFLLHLLEELDAPAVEIIVDVGIQQAVQQVEIDMVCLQPLQLLGENSLVIRIRPVVELGGQIEAVARIALHRLTDTPLRITVLIDIGRIVVVHPVLHGQVDHLMGFLVVNLRIPVLWIKRGKPHVPHSQP